MGGLGNSDVPYSTIVQARLYLKGFTCLFDEPKFNGVDNLTLLARFLNN